MREPTHSQSNGPEIELATESTATEADELSHSSVSNGTSGRILNIASYLILAIGIGTMAATAYMVLVSYTTVPYWDEWVALAPDAGLNSSLPLHWIWTQNNEHRIVFYRLLLLADLHLFKGREWPMFLAIFLSQFGLFGLLAYWLRKIAKLEGWAYRSAIGIALYCVFCPSQRENFTWGFQLSFVFVNLLFASALTALLLLAEATTLPRNRRRALLAVSILAGAAASICNANGLLVWPVLIAASLILRLRWPVIATYAVSGLVLIVLYFRGYVPPSQHMSPVAALHKPLQLIEYVANYFGSSFAPNAYPDWSLPLGFVGLSLAFCLSFLVFRRLEGRDRICSIGLLSIMGYAFLTACMTALGRVNFGIQQALSSRYQSYALLFWFAFTVLLVKFLLARNKTTALAALSLAIVAIFATSALWYKPILQVARDTRVQRELAGTSLLTGVHDDDLVKGTIWSYPPTVWDDAAYFKQHGLSIFSTEKAHGLGQPLTAVYRLAPSEPCFGFIHRIQPFKPPSGGVRLEGWAVQSKSNRPLSGIVLVNDGLISGYGVSGFQRRDVADTLHSERALYSGWIGFVEPEAKGNTTEIYGLIDSFGHPKVCKIGQAMLPGT